MSFSASTGTVSGATGEVGYRVLTPEGAPAAVVLFLPGFQLETARYLPLLEHLASWGFAVVGADPNASLFSVSHTDTAADARLCLTAALDGELAGVTAPVVTMGHSLGGKLSVMIAADDERAGGVFAIDPVNGGNPQSGYSAELPDVVPDPTDTLAMPVGFVGETVDATTDSLFGQACAPANQSYVTF